MFDFKNLESHKYVYISSLLQITLPLTTTSTSPTNLVFNLRLLISLSSDRLANFLKIRIPSGHSSRIPGSKLEPENQSSFFYMKYMYIFDNDPEFFEYLDIFFLEKEITKNHAYFYFISFIFFFTVIQQVIMGRIGGRYVIIRHFFYISKII